MKATKRLKKYIFIGVIFAVASCCMLPYLIVRIEKYLYAEDIKTIESKYLLFCQSVMRKDYIGSYQHFTPTYRQQYSLDEFQNWPEIWQYGLYPSLKRQGCMITEQRKIVFTYDGNKATFYPDEESSSLEQLTGFGIGLEKVDGLWYFTGDYNWYVD